MPLPNIAQPSPLSRPHSPLQIIPHHYKQMSMPRWYHSEEEDDEFGAWLHAMVLDRPQRTGEDGESIEEEEVMRYVKFEGH